jgi:hypothetical protein
MTNREISEFEQQRRAMTLPEFCRRYGIGRSSAYVEIAAGRLPIRKCGRRSLVTIDDAELWLSRLPSGNSMSAAT